MHASWALRRCCTHAVHPCNASCMQVSTPRRVDYIFVFARRPATCVGPPTQMSEITSSARLVGGTSVTCTARADGMDLFIGTFTNKGSKGIYRSHIDLASGSLTTPNLAAEALQPSWLRWHPSRQDIIYCANEDRDAPACSAYRVCARGRLQLLNTVSTGAAGPTHFSVSPDGRFLAVANYGGGALTVIPTAEDGSLRPASATIMHTGSGPNPKRQREPHAHSASFSACGRFIFCCDLGIDQVVIYELHPDGTVETRWELSPRIWMC